MPTPATSAPARRAPLLRAMADLADRGVTCAGCTGLCCTFVANSMQITPLEALDLYAHLAATARLTPELRAALRANVATFSLDRPPAGDGRRVFSRRRYTCPFFAGGTLGCTVAPDAKPYGCLAFNATQPGVADGEACASDQTALAVREQAAAGETDDDRAVAGALGISWDKRPIPVALLEVWAALAPEGD